MEGDTLLSVAVLKEQKQVVLQSHDGFFLRFALDEIPEQKKGAVGVRAMKLGEEDYLETVYYSEPTVETLIPYKDKEMEITRVKLGKRDSKGVKIRL